MEEVFRALCNFFYCRLLSFEDFPVRDQGLFEIDQFLIVVEEN